MSRRTTVGFEVLALLTRGVREHCPELSGAQRHLALELCLEAVDFSQGFAEDIGPRARASARLLLEIALPELPEAAVVELSMLCEGTAVRAAQRQRNRSL